MVRRQHQSQPLRTRRSNSENRPVKHLRSVSKFPLRSVPKLCVKIKTKSKTSQIRRNATLPSEKDINLRRYGIFEAFLKFSV